MNVLERVKTKLGNEIQLIGKDGEDNILVIGVFHGDEPQGKYLIDKYLKQDKAPSSKSQISVLPQGEDINLIHLSQNLRNHMTEHEVILWQHIRNRQINGAKFRRQTPIGHYICDFVSFDKKIVIELDGGQHNDFPQKNKDEQKDSFLKSQGFTVLRFWNNEIKNNLDGVIKTINDTINSCPPLVGGPEFSIPRRGIDVGRGGENNLLFIPCLNPDGMGVNTRTNSNCVDLNRNFPTKNWGKNEGENATCDDCTTNYFGGNSPASEIETQFVINIIEKYCPKLILTIHAPYKVVNYDGPAQEIAQIISKIIGYPAEGSIGYPTPGSFGTYCGVERNIPTITLELDEEKSIDELYPKMFEIFEELKGF